jgi:hypothetical protein
MVGQKRYCVRRICAAIRKFAIAIADEDVAAGLFLQERAKSSAPMVGSTSRDLAGLTTLFITSTVNAAWRG